MRFAVSILLNILILLVYLHLEYNLLKYDFVRIITASIVYLTLGIILYNISYMYIHSFNKIKKYIKRKLYERKQKIKK